MQHGCTTAVVSARSPPPDHLLYLRISEVQILIFMANYATVANRGGPLDSKRLWSFSCESVKRSALSLQKNKRTNVRHNNRKKKEERERNRLQRQILSTATCAFFGGFFFHVAIFVWERHCWRRAAFISPPSHWLKLVTHALKIHQSSVFSHWRAACRQAGNHPSSAFKRPQAHTYTHVHTQMLGAS